MVNGSNWKICERETSGPLMAKSGFSVVAPSRRMVPRSTSGSSASCWARFQRWISSTNSTVRAPGSRAARAAAVATTRRMSATELSTPDNRSKVARVVRAMTSAREVFPTPGGPWKMAETSRSASMARRRSRPGASRWDWPTYSSNVRGRIRVASGASGGKPPGGGASAVAKRSAVFIGNDRRGGT